MGSGPADRVLGPAYRVKSRSYLVSAIVRLQLRQAWVMLAARFLEVLPEALQPRQCFAHQLEACLLAMMSSIEQTANSSMLAPRFQTSSNRSIPAGANTKSTSNGLFFSCTKSFPRRISALSWGVS